MTTASEISHFFADSRIGARCTFYLSESRQSHVYMRHSARLIEGRSLKCLDIANVDVAPDEQRQGLFARLVGDCVMAATALGYDAVFAESVLNPIAAGALSRRGFAPLHAGYGPHYVLLIASP